MTEEGVVEVTLRVPKGLIQFLDHVQGVCFEGSTKEFLERSLVERISVDLQNDALNPTLDRVANKYGLKKAFDC